MGDNRTALITEDIHKSFGDNLILKEISLAAEQQDVIPIIGRSGSGKLNISYKLEN